MRQIIKSLGIGLILFWMNACTQEPMAPQQATETNPEIPPTVTQEMATSTVVPLSMATVLPKPFSSDPALFPLSGYGPYEFGTRTFSLVDTSRDNRPISITVWYPANRLESPPSNNPADNAPPNFSDAPYPVILTSAISGRIFGPHLVSHGFAVVGVMGMEPSNFWGLWLIDYPLDLVFALNQIATYSLEGLEGMIDTDHSGAMGYSFGGYDTLALSGARVDPDFYLSQCATASTMEPPPADWWVRYICAVADDWDEFTAHAGEEITSSDDGLWQPLTDDRILAVIPMAPEGAWLFGERGLEAANRPTLIIGATMDEGNYYDLEAAYIFEHLGTSDRRLISFIGQDHMMVFEKDQVSKMKHFAAAFFGYYLQGRVDYAAYISEEFVSLFDDLAWGVFPEQ